MSMLAPIIYSSAASPVTPDSATKMFDIGHYPALEKLDSGEEGCKRITYI